jgi:hypothetical protein
MTVPFFPSSVGLRHSLLSREGLSAAGVKNDLITKKHLAKMLPIEEDVCNWHLNPLKQFGFISGKLASTKSQTEFERTNR